MSAKRDEVCVRAVIHRVCRADEDAPKATAQPAGFANTAGLGSSSWRCGARFSGSAAIFLAPVLTCISVVRQHRRLRNRRRTSILMASWIAGFGAIALAGLTSILGCLVPVILFAVWHISDQILTSRWLQVDPLNADQMTPVVRFGLKAPWI